MAASTRYLARQVQDDLATKMVFVAGPRQVGKTTLALDLPGACAGYLNTADACQIALHGERDYVTAESIRAVPAVEFLRTLV